MFSECRKTMDFLKRLFGAKPANSVPALSSGATAPQMPTPAAPVANAAVGGRRRSRRHRKQTRKHRKHSRKHGRK